MHQLKPPRVVSKADINSNVSFGKGIANLRLIQYALKDPDLRVQLSQPHELTPASRGYSAGNYCAKSGLAVWLGIPVQPSGWGTSPNASAKCDQVRPPPQKFPVAPVSPASQQRLSNVSHESFVDTTLAIFFMLSRAAHLIIRTL